MFSLNSLGTPTNGGAVGEVDAQIHREVSSVYRHFTVADQPSIPAPIGCIPVIRVTVPRQHDGFNCGIFAMRFMAAISSQLDLFIQLVNHGASFEDWMRFWGDFDPDQYRQSLMGHLVIDCGRYILEHYPDDAWWDNKPSGRALEQVRYTISNYLTFRAMPLLSLY